MMHARRGLRMGLGPVFAFEWIALTRRWRWYAMRSLFAALLLAALFVILSDSRFPTGGMTFRELARLGQAFYVAVIGTQLTLVLLAAPAATAGSICLDRASGKLTHMLVTDLSDSEIVLGKLASRLLPVLGLVACALPLLAIMTLLGGRGPQRALGAFLVTVGCAVLGCSLALIFSLWSKKTHEALLGTYSVWGLWLVGRPFLAMVNGAFGWSFSLPPRIADPYFLAFAPYWNPASVSFDDYVWFLVITAGISAVLAIVAIFRLRAVCTRVDVAKKKSVRGRLERMGVCLRPDPLPARPLARLQPRALARVAQESRLAVGEDRRGALRDRGGDRQHRGDPGAEDELRHGLGQRIAGRHRHAPDERDRGVVAVRGAVAGEPRRAHDHTALDPRDRAREMAGDIPAGADAGGPSGARRALQRPHEVVLRPIRPPDSRLRARLRRGGHLSGTGDGDPLRAARTGGGADGDLVCPRDRRLAVRVGLDRARAR